VARFKRRFFWKKGTVSRRTDTSIGAAMCFHDDSHPHEIYKIVPGKVSPGRYKIFFERIPGKKKEKR
jgi:hypothetical protein